MVTKHFKVMVSEDATKQARRETHTNRTGTAAGTTDTYHHKRSMRNVNTRQQLFLTKTNQSHSYCVPTMQETRRNTDTNTGTQWGVTGGTRDTFHTGTEHIPPVNAPAQTSQI